MAPGGITRTPGPRATCPRTCTASRSPKTDWTRKFAEQPEILGYFESLVDSHGLATHLRFGTEVVATTWSDDDSTWELELGDGERITADVGWCRGWVS